MPSFKYSLIRSQEAAKLMAQAQLQHRAYLFAASA